MARPLWLVALLRRALPWRFRLARATHVPVLGRLLRRWLFEDDRLLVVPRRAVTVRLDLDIPAPEQMVLPYRVAEHFVDRARFRWIMDACICRQAHGCRDYPVELGCLFLGEAARDIHPRLGRPASAEEARAHLRRCREAGLVHLVGRNKLDTIWLGVGPGTRLVTICSCCPCCCLWRMLPHVADGIAGQVQAMPGVRVTVTERCQACGTCVAACFVSALRLEPGGAVVGPACRGCGRCVEACPNDAIELTIDGEAYLDRAIAEIEALVDVQ